MVSHISLASLRRGPSHRPASNGSTSPSRFVQPALALAMMSILDPDCAWSRCCCVMLRDPPFIATYLSLLASQVVVNAPVSADGLGVATTSLIYERTIQL